LAAVMGRRHIDEGLAGGDPDAVAPAVAAVGALTAGTPAAETPAAGTPAAGTPGAGTPAAGTPGAGTPAAGRLAGTVAAPAVEGPLEVQCRPDTPDCVVLGGHRRTEEHHRGVADVLLHHPAVLADDAPDRRVELALLGPYALRSGPFGVRRRAHRQIGSASCRGRASE